MWLLETTALQSLEYAVKNIGLTDDQRADYVASFGSTAVADPSRIMSVGGSVATINIQGLLTKGRSFMSFFMGGGTTYAEIIAAMDTAEQDENVDSIVLNIDSPGGQVDGMFAAMSAIADATKPTKSVISGTGASAAFGLASQAGTVVAASRAVRIGSIGVAASFYVFDGDIDVASTEAPKKRPDVRTDEGKAVVREELDGIHNLFVEAIAKGRGTTEKKVNADFGRGATVLADKALTTGMIDSIAESDKSLLTDSDNDENMETSTMDLSELKTKHPDIYQAAMKDGADIERDRINAHLTMGEACGDMPTALAAVADGSQMTQALSAKYMVASMNRKDIEDRQDDDDGATGADDAIGADGEEEADIVAGLIETQMGVSADA